MYGITLTDDFLFIAAQVHKRSVVVRFERPTDDLQSIRDPMILLDSMVDSTNGRVHQINHAAGHLWVTATDRNSILRIDAESGSMLSEIWPLTDSFGRCIVADHNHINSVHVFGESIVFTAYGAGDHSLVGVIDERRNVTGFRYANMGIHDIYFERDNFYFCDTFGNADEPERGGVLVTRHGPHPSDVFAKQPGYIPRGVVKSGTQLVVGNSHKGNRSLRFKGKGSLLLFVDDVFHYEHEMPCAQIYQLIRTDGWNSDDCGDDLRAGDMTNMLAESLGPPVYSGTAFWRESDEMSDSKPLRQWRMRHG